MHKERPEIKIELDAYTSRKSESDYDNFLFDVKQYQHNQTSTSSMPLIGKTVETLEKKSLNRLFAQKRVKSHLSTHKIRKEIDLPQKLKSLNLMTNGYVLKGTFLCLANIDQIRSVSNNAYISKFFVFEDLKGMRTGVTEFVLGNLIDQFQQMLSHIKRNLYLLRDIDTRSDDYEIPEEVFTELLANAFVHRSYESDVFTDIKIELYPDRMEISNPGKFPEQLDLQNVANNNKSFIINPEIVQIFYLHEYVETAAKGIRRSQELLSNYRLPLARFEQGNGFVNVVIYKTKRPPVPRRLETVNRLLNEKNISAFFTFMENEIGSHELLNELRLEYIKTGSTDTFEDRLKVFAASVLK
jgi:predicted HTH transcriptional regulator